MPRDFRRHASPAAVIVLAAAIARIVGLDAVPPGLHFDEAVYGLMAVEIQNGARPAFFPAYTGREPLYMYLLALVFTATGPSAFAIRLTSAWIGTVMTAIVIALGRRLYSPAVGLMAGAFSAVVMWPVVVGRNGYPNVLIPPLAAAAAIALWRGWDADDVTRDRRRHWVIGGALTGLLMYTYLAARFWPVFLIVLLLWAAVTQPQQLRARLGGLGLAAAAAAIVVAPLAIHFARHPEDFWQRADQVLAARQLVGEELWRTYAANAWRSLRGLFEPLAGDPRWHFNLPGRPVYGAPAAIATAIGTLVCLRNIRHLRYAIPVLWLIVLALPGVLTLEMQPAGQRIFGVWPALALLAGIGVTVTARALARHARMSAHLAFGCLALVIAGHEAWRTARDLPRWAALPQTIAEYDTGYVTLAGQARSELREGKTLVILAEHWHHATIALLAPEALNARWADPRLALPLPMSDGHEIVYLLPASFVAEEQARQAALDQPIELPLLSELQLLATTGQCIAAVDVGIAQAPAARSTNGRDGGPFDPHNPCGATDHPARTLRYTVATGQPARPASHAANLEKSGASAIPASFAVPADAPSIGGEVAVAGWTAAVTAARDRPVALDVRWRVIALPPGGVDRTFAVHLVDDYGHTWAQADTAGYLATEWRTGDHVRQRFTLALDRAMPPGRYRARILLTDENGRRLPAAGPRGRVSALDIGDVHVLPDGRRRAEVGTVPIALFGGTPDQASVLEEAGGGLAIIEAAALPAEFRAADGLVAEILWSRAGATAPGADVTDVRFTLRPVASGADRSVLLPIANEHPPAQWARREMLRGRYVIPVPDDISGTVNVEVSVPGLGETIVLGQTTVVGFERRYEPPAAVDVALGADFGEQVRLLGVDLDPAAPRAGQALRVTLWWSALADMDRRWKVFVHLDDEDGNLVAQDDAEPAGGSRPTDGWRKGEVIEDDHELMLLDSLPAEGLTLGIGLYDPATGERAPALDDAGRVVPDGKIRSILPPASKQ